MNGEESYRWLKAVLILSFFALPLMGSSGIGQKLSTKVRERLELRKSNGQVITTLWPRNRELFLFFANSLANEYKLPMHTIQIPDGVAIEFGPRAVESKSLTKGGLDKEVILTVSNGNLKRRFHINESELSFNSLSKILMLMGYRVGVSTGGDLWSVSRKTYVPPEPLNEEFGAMVQQFISASIGKDAASLKELFAETVHFANKNEPDSLDHISNEQAAERFLEEYPANKILVLRWSFGVEGQSVVYLAAENEQPSKAEWCILFYAVKDQGKYLINGFNNVKNFWLPGENLDAEN